MEFRCTVLLMLCCLAGIRGLKLPEPSFRLLEEEIDDVSDSSSDLTEPQEQPPESVEASSDEEVSTTDLESLIQDQRVYGMNIGLHYILENINTKLAVGDKVHLESLIKVLVMTHKIEQVGGTVNENNENALKNVAELFPKSLREAIGQ